MDIKKTLINTLFVIVAALMAANTATADDLKIGVVNAAKVLEQSPQAADARKNLQKEFAPRDKQLVEASKEIKQLEDKMARDGAIMSNAEREKIERDLVVKQRDMQRDREAFREDLNLRRNDELGKLQRRVMEMIVGISKEEHYDLILSDGVVYASDKADITHKVLERLKKEYTEK